MLIIQVPLIQYILPKRFNFSGLLNFYHKSLRNQGILMSLFNWNWSTPQSCDDFQGCTIDPHFLPTVRQTDRAVLKEKLQQIWLFKTFQSLLLEYWNFWDFLQIWPVDLSQKNLHLHGGHKINFGIREFVIYILILITLQTTEVVD